MAIVIVTGNDGTMYYYGPFADGNEATHWAAMNCKGFEWHWDNLCLVNQPEEEEAE